MSITHTAMGVCAACKHDPECIYEDISRGVVLQCEQFEMGFREQPARPAPVRARAESGRVKDTNGYAGLCSNCDNRETCIYPKPEGGVWRCEEYV
jgi:hypothetical protein